MRCREVFFRAFLAPDDAARPAPLATELIRAFLAGPPVASPAAGRLFAAMLARYCSPRVVPCGFPRRTRSDCSTTSLALVRRRGGGVGEAMGSVASGAVWKDRSSSIEGRGGKGGAKGSRVRPELLPTLAALEARTKTFSASGEAESRRGGGITVNTGYTSARQFSLSTYVR